jgi:IclR family pca regulon transcriptional regulator
LLDADGVPLAGLSIAAPTFNTNIRDFEATGARPVMQAAKALSRALQTTGGFAKHQTTS